ncbi:MAG TPA: hypothetical protein VHK69_11055 [Chitinophagaceae bacterium]|jgi:hypothetical protein|nr:hypothetical protein [Chitinophagaceae bacterium]
MLLLKRMSTLLLGLAILAGGCDKDEVDATAPVLRLVPESVTGKAGRMVEATLFITAPNGAKDVVVYKTVNLQRDNTYGGTGTLTAVPVSTGGNSYEYKFSYELNPDEVDKLVGFNFRFTDNKGLAAEKDLTVNTTTSGQQTIYARRWKLISKMWTSISPAAEMIEECEKDNIYSWNRDSTVSITYGASGCTFDGFNIYDRWTLSEDEKTFTQVYHSVFDPSNITTEVYKVKSISKDRLVMEILVDLSIFGPPYTDKEVFVYTFEPAP